jgi:hypothetical protein
MRRRGRSLKRAIEKLGVSNGSKGVKDIRK